MPSSKQAREHEITISDLYPELTPEQQEEARNRLRRYLEIVRGIFERTHGFDERRPIR